MRPLKQKTFREEEMKRRSRRRDVIDGLRLRLAGPVSIWMTGNILGGSFQFYKSSQDCKKVVIRRAVEICYNSKVVSDFK